MALDSAAGGAEERGARLEARIRWDVWFALPFSSAETSYIDFEACFKASVAALRDSLEKLMFFVP